MKFRRNIDYCLRNTGVSLTAAIYVASTI